MVEKTLSFLGTYWPSDEAGLPVWLIFCGVVLVLALGFGLWKMQQPERE